MNRLAGLHAHYLGRVVEHFCDVLKRRNIKFLDPRSLTNNYLQKHLNYKISKLNADKLIGQLLRHTSDLPVCPCKSIKQWLEKRLLHANNHQIPRHKSAQSAVKQRVRYTSDHMHVCLSDANRGCLLAYHGCCPVAMSMWFKSHYVRKQQRHFFQQQKK